MMYDRDEEQDDEFSEEDFFDEDPSDAEIEALDHESAHCPDCGAEVWDGAEICPKCYAYIGGNTTAEPRRNDWLARHWRLILIILIVIGVLLGTFLSLPAAI